MKRLMSHNAIFQMNQAIHQAEFEGRVSSLFRYALKKNLDTTQAEVNSMVEAFKPDSEFLKYRDELKVIASEYGVDNIDDYIAFDLAIKALPTEQNAEFTRRQTELADKYKDALERQTLADSELNAFLEEKIEIDICMVPIEQCPEIKGPKADVIQLQLFPMFIPPKEPDDIASRVEYEV